MRTRATIESPDLHPASGLSLVELLIALSVAATLALIAAPRLTSQLSHLRLAQATDSLALALHRARLSAMLLRMPVTLCPSHNGIACGDASSWSTGWLVATGTGSAATTPLAAGNLPPGLTIQTTSGRALVRYQPDGRSTGSNMTFTLCSNGHWQRQIILNNAGRVRSTAITRENC